MICNQEELAVIRRQLALVEDGLAALRQDIEPRNARNFEILAEGYFRQIRQLRAEIEAFLGLPPLVPASNSSSSVGANL